MQDSPLIQQLPVETGIPDAQLLEAWVEHERQADFTEIVRRHLGLVQGIARRQLDPHLAEDIAQQVFAILARKAATLTDLRSLAAWLHRVTLLQCHSAVRRRMRDRRDQEAAMESARIAEARDPLADAFPHLDEVINELSESDRELILLRYSEGLSFSEAAKRIGRKEAALRQQASRAVEKLSGLLRSRGVAIPAATLTTGLGIQLAGTSTATAAGVVSATSLAAATGITGWSLAGLTFLTMTLKQSIVAGAALAALLITGPLVWRASQIRQAERSLAAVSSPGPERTIALTDGSVAPSEETRSTQARSRRPLTEADRTRMINAIPGIIEATLKESMNDWGVHDAWVEARRTARMLGLSAGLETDLRNLLAAEHARAIAASNLEQDENTYAADQRERAARVEAWYAAHLTPEQSEGRKRMNEERDAATAGNLAREAVEGISSKVELTDEQEARLHEIAVAKVTRTLEEKSAGNSVMLGASFGFNGKTVPIDDLSADFVRSVLDPDQQELWMAAREREQSVGESMQKRVIGGILQQFAKVMPTHEELFGPSEE